MSQGERPIVVFRIGEWLFGLDATLVASVVQMVEITPLPRAPGAVQGVIDVGGQIIPVFSIRRRFHLPERPVEPGDFVVLARASDRQVALMAEEIIEVRKAGTGWVDREDLGVPAESIAGVVRTPDGLILIQELDTFLFSAEEEKLEEALRTHVDR